MVPLKILLLFGYISFVLTHVSMDDFLDEELKKAKTEIAKLSFRDEQPVERKVYNVSWDKLWQQDFEKEQLFTVNAFNRILLIEGNRVLTLLFDTPPSNQTFSRQIILTGNDGSTKFVKSIIWKNVLYLLICRTTGSCSLYTGTEAGTGTGTGTDNFQLRHRQSIQHKGYPMDASFFVRANRLYLVVADNYGKFAVPSLNLDNLRDLSINTIHDNKVYRLYRIYHWRGTYMDVVAEIMTTAAVSVTTFRHKQSTIIVFAQNDENLPNIGSMVYEFKEDSPERIQYLYTLNPVAIYHYNHADFNFIFLTNEHSPSNLFWWDGHELLNWVQIPDIEECGLFHDANIDDDTFFLVGCNNTLLLYKFENASHPNLVTSIKLANSSRVIDVQIEIKESTITMLLVVMNKYNIYVIESWKLRVDEIPSDYSTKESDMLSKHLAELIELLQQRKPIVDNYESLWPSLLPVDEDLAITEPLVLPTLILDTGTVENIDVFVTENVITPGELEENIKNLTQDVNDTLTRSKTVPTLNNTNLSNRNIVVDGDAFIESLRINKMNADFFNDFDTHSNDIIDSNKTEESLLRGNNIVINTLCGIPFKHWILNNDTSRLAIDVAADKIVFSNDTVVLHSNISTKHFNAITLNNINLDEFFGELFIIDKNQRIKGDIICNDMLQIQNLTMQALNGEPFHNYVTTNTDQYFDSLAIESLELNELHGISINGVPVSEAARISNKNVIKGEVNIARLQVTDRLTADFHFGLPESQHQIYYNVTINANLKIATLDVDKHTTIFLNDKELKLNNVSETFWRKSTDQTIENSVTFEKNVVIDHLRTKYLNGLTTDEFLYANATMIPQTFKKLHFESVHVEDTFFARHENNSFFEVAPESVTIQKKLRVKQLRTNQLFTEIYNDFLITDILNGKPSIFSRTTNIPTVRAKRVNVDELRFHFFNNTDSAALLRDANDSEKNGEATFPKTSEFHVKNLNVERINDIDMTILLNNTKMSDLKTLIIDDDLTVGGNIQIDRIDDQSAITYLRNMVKEDIVFNGKLTLDELTVRNATMESLHGYNSKDLFDGVFSKSREQVVPGNFSFYKITTRNVGSKFIDNKNASELKWIDEPLFLTGNITFEDLIIERDVATRLLNGRDVNELYNNPLNLSVANIDTLKVDGNISWSYSILERSYSLTSLLENAMTKSTDQTVLGDVVFENDASASRVEVTIKYIDEIRDIVEDTVTDDNDIIRVDGVKIFNQSVTIDNLLVTGDTNIPVINNISIIDFNMSVAKKDESETISESISFLDEVTINELLVDDNVDNLPLEGLTLATDTLPRVTFKNLIVSEDVSLKNLDGVDFDKFMRNRLTTDEDHEIFIDVEFNDIVEVTGNATVARINGIDPTDLILDGMQETQLISGSKIFEEDVVVQGNINTKLINNVDISSEYKSGIQTDEDVEIIGDLVFASAVNVPKNVYVSKLMNGIHLHTVQADSEKVVEKTVQMFERNESTRNEKIRESALISSTMGNIFSYIEEEEEQLKIQAPNIKKVDVVYYGETTKLNMFGEESGSSCGLPDNCSCPTQYVAELTNEGCRIRKTNGTIIVRNYHESRNVFGVNVITNIISNGRDCVRNRSENEFITISWMKLALSDTGDVLANTGGESSPQIRGFIKDAKVFAIHENAAFVVLAINYDTLFATRRTSSLIYTIDSEKNLLSLQQELHTDGASAIETFQTNQHDTYLLIGCFGNSEKSFLYKLNTLTSKFITVRTFGGKTRNAKSLRRDEDHFILLDDYDTNAVNIFHYDSEYDNFNNYQSLFHDSSIEGIEIFYSDEHGQSDSFVIVTTTNDQFYIYKFTYAQKFQMKSHHRIDDLQIVTPFKYFGNLYVFVGTNRNSTILRIVQQGPR